MSLQSVNERSEESPVACPSGTFFETLRSQSESHLLSHYRLIHYTRVYYDKQPVPNVGGDSILGRVLNVIPSVRSPTGGEDLNE